MVGAASTVAAGNRTVCEQTVLNDRRAVIHCHRATVNADPVKAVLSIDLIPVQAKPVVLGEYAVADRRRAEINMHSAVCDSQPVDDRFGINSGYFKNHIIDNCRRHRTRIVRIDAAESYALVNRDGELRIREARIRRIVSARWNQNDVTVSRRIDSALNRSEIRLTGDDKRPRLSELDRHVRVAQHNHYVVAVPRRIIHRPRPASNAVTRLRLSSQHHGRARIIRRLAAPLDGAVSAQNRNIQIVVLHDRMHTEVIADINDAIVG